jgi:hypothetical protein
MPDIVNRASIHPVFRSDGSPLSTCGDDKDNWYFPTSLAGNPAYSVIVKNLPGKMKTWEHLVKGSCEP